MKAMSMQMEERKSIFTSVPTRRAQSFTIPIDRCRTEPVLRKVEIQPALV